MRQASSRPVLGSPGVALANIGNTQQIPSTTTDDDGSDALVSPAATNSVATDHSADALYAPQAESKSAPAASIAAVESTAKAATPATGVHVQFDSTQASSAAATSTYRGYLVRRCLRSISLVIEWVSPTQVRHPSKCTDLRTWKSGSVKIDPVAGGAWFRWHWEDSKEDSEEKIDNIDLDKWTQALADVLDLEAPSSREGHGHRHRFEVSVSTTDRLMRNPEYSDRVQKITARSEPLGTDPDYALVHSQRKPPVGARRPAADVPAHVFRDTAGHAPLVCGDTTDVPFTAFFAKLNGCVTQLDQFHVKVDFSAGVDGRSNTSALSFSTPISDLSSRNRTMEKLVRELIAQLPEQERNRKGAKSGSTADLTAVKSSSGRTSTSAFMYSRNRFGKCRIISSRT